MREFIGRVLSRLAPRFITEDMVAIVIERRDDGTHYHDTVELIKPLAWVEDGEDFDYIITLRYFNLLGWAFDLQYMGEPRPFVQSTIHNMRPPQ
jgi:hypothetical protein